LSMDLQQNSWLSEVRSLLLTDVRGSSKEMGLRLLGSQHLVLSLAKR